jgi:hypothetical protein
VREEYENVALGFWATLAAPCIAALTRATSLSEVMLSVILAGPRLAF